MRTEQSGPYTAIEQEGGWWTIEQDFVRSFLFTGSREALLVDTCDADADLKSFVEKLSSLPIRVVQTHGDPDHIGASARFEKVYLHPAENNHLRLTSSKPLHTSPLWEGESIDLGGRSFEVILIPGHTPGSIALLDRENRVLLSGDSVKADTVYAFGQGRDLDAYIASLEKLNRIKDSFDRVLPSHGELFVSPDIISELIEGAVKLKQKELPAFPADIGGCKLYRWKRISFFY
jgi:glyoxylase-like metal-dependent hydrolase (beta-lactamase superfamily II)